MSEKKLKIILPVAIMVFGIAVTIAMIRSRGPVPTRPSHDYSPVVRITKAEPRTHQIIIRANGTVRPRTETELVSEAAGRVVSTAPSFAAGGFFKKGDVLVTIDPSDYEFAVVTAREKVAQARVRFKTEEAQAKVAKEEWKQLGDGKPSPLAARELQLQEARAALDAAEAALEQAKRNLSKTKIRAPYSGRVREKLVDIGQFVSPGVPVARIYAVDYAEVRLPIPDSELAYLDLPLGFRSEEEKAKGPEVLLHASFAGKNQTWTGRIVRVEGEIDPASRMVHVVAQVDDPYGLEDKSKHAPISIGLFVEAEIMGYMLKNSFVLPRSAVRNDSTVIVVDEGNRLHFRKVKIMRMDRSNVVITGGLVGGERVCISALQDLTEGTRVRTFSEPAQSTEARIDS